MKQNLDTLATEILDSLATGGFVVYHGRSRPSDTASIIYWDCEQYPDFGAFLGAAKHAGAKLIVFRHQRFCTESVEDALERLEQSSLRPEEKKSVEETLAQMREYAGFTSLIELSFDHQGRTYMFDMHTEWYDEFLDVVDDIDACVPDAEEGNEGPYTDYFSRN